MKKREEMSLDLQAKMLSVQAMHDLPKSTHILRALLAKMTLSCHHKVHKILQPKANLTKTMFKSTLFPRKQDRNPEGRNQKNQGKKKQRRLRQNVGKAVPTKCRYPRRRKQRKDVRKYDQRKIQSNDSK